MTRFKPLPMHLRHRVGRAGRNFKIFETLHLRIRWIGLMMNTMQSNHEHHNDHSDPERRRLMRRSRPTGRPLPNGRPSLFTALSRQPLSTWERAASRTLWRPQPPRAKKSSRPLLLCWLQQTQLPAAGNERLKRGEARALPLGSRELGARHLPLNSDSRGAQAVIS